MPTFQPFDAPDQNPFRPAGRTKTPAKPEYLAALRAAPDREHAQAVVFDGDEQRKEYERELRRAAAELTGTVHIREVPHGGKTYLVFYLGKKISKKRGAAEKSESETTDKPTDEKLAEPAGEKPTKPARQPASRRR